MKAACIQMNISLCSKQENLERALSLAEEAVSKEADLLVFPEVFSTGFCYDHIEELAETASGPTLEALLDFSREHGCILSGSMIEKKERKESDAICLEKKTPSQFNLGFCIESGKLTGIRRKVQLYGMEKEYFAPGDSIAPIRLQKYGLSIGLLVCNELRYPEVARKLALEGADLLVSVADIPDFYIYPWRIMSLSRALENQLPHIACTRVGKDRYSTYPGGSFIVDGWGRILAEAGMEECVLLGEIDLEEAKEIRQTGSILEDRRPDLY
ncbi:MULTISPECIES: carbon-nitrogen hydrolase family protein [unclassified Methanosarcina]|uniref:carbon-nitrogen hydrolase family protein n=1 Tax=unclassified Methanosarcina TaxID=2644672 RepID=UPI0006154AC5|nr:MULTISPECIES: nitrilase-related carbon-nitrogen hydrolase [unclassified Methanosarcina]AKB16975.1 Carbon-nitrogen hydrolase [Methanosarcina sp. WWM596]AKB20381.1 Carbon-nitrogen hydrolase [Methanosarcina sp. WH1]